MYLGATEFSAQDMLRGQLAHRVNDLRKEGMSDLAIRAYLMGRPDKDSPCMGPDGSQLCTSDDIDAAFGIAPGIRDAEKELSRRPVSTKTILVAAGIALIAIVALAPRHKGR